ncbi:fimbrillin family protein [Parabacteroides sp.]
MLCSHKENDYTSIAWKREVTVATDGTVVYPDATPLYPHYGAFVYLTGLHPIPANAGRIVKGLVTWTLDGTTDLMYAPQLAGNRWDGFRIHGNTDPKLDKTLEFNHQLTQLRFCAVRKANTVESNEFRVTRITLKAVPAKASFTVAGVAEKDLAVDFTEPGDLAAVLYMDKANPSKTVLVTSTDADNPDAVGYVLLPAAAKYTADIETTLGTFLSREVKSADGPFTKGYANQITLHLSEDGLSITGVQLEDWTDEDGGEVNVN